MAKPTKIEIEAIVNKPYAIDIVYGDTPDEGVVAKVAEWPGCMTAGATREEAFGHIGDAMRDWVTARLEDGLDVPEPMATYSGKVLLRLPRDVHRAAEMRAYREGTSLNTWLTMAIARELGPVELPKALKVVPMQMNIWAGLTAAFKAENERGDVVHDVEWSLSRRDLGRIDEAGVFTSGRNAMTAQVIARRGDLEARADVHVMPVRNEAASRELLRQVNVAERSRSDPLRRR